LCSSASKAATATWPRSLRWWRRADLILLAPEGQQANLIAYVVSGLGQMFLEKSGAVEGGSSATH
jgi:hypothetical protein